MRLSFSSAEFRMNEADLLNRIAALESEVFALKRRDKLIYLHGLKTANTVKAHFRGVPNPVLAELETKIVEVREQMATAAEMVIDEFMQPIVEANLGIAIATTKLFDLVQNALADTIAGTIQLVTFTDNFVAFHDRLLAYITIRDIQIEKSGVREDGTIFFTMENGDVLERPASEITLDAMPMWLLGDELREKVEKLQQDGPYKVTIENRSN